MVASQYTPAEGRARDEIDEKLTSAGWVVQSRPKMNLYEGAGQAVREFILRDGHGRVDYLLFVDQQPIGTIEAKPAGTTLIEVELQSMLYSTGLPQGFASSFERLPFAFESTGKETRFTNGLDPEPRSRRVFSFPRPETLKGWTILPDETEPPTALWRLQQMPPLITDSLWSNQERAIRNLEASLALGRRRALIQMATGSGKTFTAANIAYRLIKHARSNRILFLVDRANLGRQTKAEFDNFSTPDDGRKFSELYNVQHLTHNKPDQVARVTISTIQRIYSILRGEAEMDPILDEMTGMEVEPTRPVDVSYNSSLPPEFFDLIIVDECHRSIYGVWRQVLEYFDATIVGLTATPSKQTFGFFDGNLVMEYGREQAVADGVNVDFDIYRIRTEISENGSIIGAGLVTGFRDRDTRALRWQKLDEDVAYQASDLDRKVVSEDQIRTVIRTFRDKLFTEIFPDRTQVPKTLIFAKDDSHADDIVQIVRDEFGKGNEFAVKITYRTDGKPEDMLSNFRNSYDPRIVVTVDMIATGTDVKPIEIVLFMRSVKSRIYFEQMIGRGSRVIDPTDLDAVTPDAGGSKTHFVIVDAVGVTETELMDSRPLDREPTTPLRKLFQNVAAGMASLEDVSSLAGRLARLNRQVTPADRARLEDALGQSLQSLTAAMVEATDPDRHLARAEGVAGGEPDEKQIEQVRREMIKEAVKPIAANPAFRDLWQDLKRSYEQTIDETSQDRLIHAGAVTGEPEWAKNYTDSFRRYLEENRDEIAALRFFYSVPWKDRPSFAEIRELAAAIERTPQAWTPENLWKAYEALDKSRVRGSGQRMLSDVVSLVRYALGLTGELVPYRDVVEERYAGWLAQQEQAGRVFTTEQRRWLDMIKDHLVTSLGITTEDFEYTPFSQEGGLGKATQVFGSQLNDLLDELNRELVA